MHIRKKMLLTFCYQLQTSIVFPLPEVVLFFSSNQIAVFLSVMPKALVYGCTANPTRCYFQLFWCYFQLFRCYFQLFLAISVQPGAISVLFQLSGAISVQPGAISVLLLAIWFYFGATWCYFVAIFQLSGAISVQPGAISVLFLAIWCYFGATWCYFGAIFSYLVLSGATWCYFGAILSYLVLFRCNLVLFRCNLVQPGAIKCNLVQ